MSVKLLDRATADGAAVAQIPISGAPFESRIVGSLIPLPLAVSDGATMRVDVEVDPGVFVEIAALAFPPGPVIPSPAFWTGDSNLFWTGDGNDFWNQSGGLTGFTVVPVEVDIFARSIRGRLSGATANTDATLILLGPGRYTPAS